VFSGCIPHDLFSNDCYTHTSDSNGSDLASKKELDLDHLDLHNSDPDNPDLSNPDPDNPDPHNPNPDNLDNVTSLQESLLNISISDIDKEYDKKASIEIEDLNVLKVYIYMRMYVYICIRMYIYMYIM
jgi:hypothetical protein